MRQCVCDRGELLTCDGSAHASDDVSEAVLVRGDDIHVTLDYHGSACSRNGIGGAVQGVDQLGFLEVRCFRSVDVLGLGVVHGSSGESDDVAVAIAEREHDAVDEHVAPGAVFWLSQQSRPGCSRFRHPVGRQEV